MKALRGRVTVKPAAANAGADTNAETEHGALSIWHPQTRGPVLGGEFCHIILINVRALVTHLTLTLML